MRSAILFLVFNRPEPTREVFERIRAARPSRLYVAADGARGGRVGEAERCAETRRIATAVDWGCDIKVLFRDANLGCKRAVSSAIGWFFDQEEEGIVLEDDCVPDLSFFQFCDELLEYYRNSERIAMISGDNFQFGRQYGADSYYFSKYAHIWGWATWRRVWRLYDRDAACWPRFRDGGGLSRVLGGRRREIAYWTKIFDAVHGGRIDTWDYQLNLLMWANDMVSVIPQKNLISNIGFGPEATHTNGASKYADLEAKEMEFPLKHPERCELCVAADEATTREMFLRSVPARACDKVRGLLANALRSRSWKPV